MEIHVAPFTTCSKWKFSTFDDILSSLVERTVCMGELEIDPADMKEEKARKRREKAFLTAMLGNKLSMIQVGMTQREVMTEKHFQILPGGTFDNGFASRPMCLPITCKVHTLGALDDVHHAQTLLYDLQVSHHV